MKRRSHSNVPTPLFQRPGALAALLRLALLSLFTLLLALSCGGSKDSGESTTQTIGSGGGTLTIAGGTLTIPKGALTEDTRITFAVSEMGAPEVSGRVRVTRSFRIEPDAVRFLTFATLSIAYETSRLPRNVTVSEFDLRRLDASNAQERLNGVSVDISSDQISGEVLRGGTFWATVPDRLRPAAISVSPDVQAMTPGETLQLSVSVFDQTGSEMKGDDAAISLESTVPEVASVDSSGLVTAVSPGWAKIAVRAGAARAWTEIRVRSPDSALPDAFEWQNPLPQGNSITAIARDTSGRILFGTSDGSIWREREASGTFDKIYQFSGARFSEFAFSDGGRVEAAGALGTSGFLVTLTPPDNDGSSWNSFAFTAANSPFTKIAVLGETGVSSGPGTYLLVRWPGESDWVPVESPTFDAIAAAVPLADTVRVLTVAGVLFDLSRQGASVRLNASGGPAAVVDAAALNDGTLAALGKDGVLYRVGADGIWTRSAVLPFPRTEGENSEEEEADGDESPDAGGDAPSNDGGDDDADSGTSGTDMDASSFGETSDSGTQESETSELGLISCPGIFRLGTSVLLRCETIEGKQALLENRPDDATASNSSGTFTALPLPSDGSSILWGTDGAHLLAAGAAGALHSWDGTQWQEVSTGAKDWIIGLSAFDDGSVLALTERCLDNRCLLVQNAVLLRSPASDRFEDITPSEGFSGRRRALAGFSADDFWVLGEGGLAYRFSDGSWSSEDHSLLGAVYGAVRCGNALFAVGENATIASLSQGEWGILERLGGGTLRGAACNPERNDLAFAVGDYLISIRDGETFAVITPNDSAIRTALWKTAWVSPTGEAFIGGDARYLLFWNGENFDFFDAPARLSIYNFRALAGTSLSDVWAAGTLTTGEGFLVHFNGAEWRRIPLPSTRPILALHSGQTPGSLWVGGGNGTILYGAPPKITEQDTP